MSEQIEKSNQDNTIRSPAERWRHLRENGPKILVDLSSNDSVSGPPPWLDEERFKRAKEALNKFLIGVDFSSFTGLLLILQLPDGLEPLLTTGNSKDIPSLYQRYVSTIVHVNSWYEDDIFDESTKGYKSIRQVRSMHRHVQKLMNERHQVPDYAGKKHLWMTQYDVALTQFAFIGLAMLYPKKTAMIAASKEELEAINYYWRVLGWLMGMRDDLNLCQFDRYEDIREFNELIFKHEYLDKFATLPCDLGLRMTQSICLALHYFVPLITFNSLAHWWQDCFSFNGYKLQPLSGRERILSAWTSLSFNRLLKYERLLRFSNLLHKSRFQKRLKNREKVYNDLCEQYKDCEHLTYHSERIDYFAKSPSITNLSNGAREQQQANGPIEVGSELNNNNTNGLQEIVHEKQKVVGTCPLGFGAGAGTPTLGTSVAA